METMWRKGQRLKVEGSKVYVDHVFEDGSASVRDAKTGLLKGKIPSKLNHADIKNQTNGIADTVNNETFDISSSGISVKEYNELLAAQEEYENFAEKYYLSEESGTPDAKLKKQMDEKLHTMSEMKNQIFNNIEN